MEFASFTCQFCAEHQDWDTPRAADAAAVWHLFHARPGRWLARTSAQGVGGNLFRACHRADLRRSGPTQSGAARALW